MLSLVIINKGLQTKKKKTNDEVRNGNLYHFRIPSDIYISKNDT